jgi:hypothetical protein
MEGNEHGVIMGWRNATLLRHYFDGDGDGKVDDGWENEYIGC